MPITDPSTSYFRASHGAYGCTFESLHEQYELIQQHSALGPQYRIRSKTSLEGKPIAFPISLETRVATLTHLIKLAANDAPYSLSFKLVNDPRFKLFAKTIVGAESLKTRLRRAIKKASFLNKGGADPASKLASLRSHYWQEALLPRHPYGKYLYRNYVGLWETSSWSTCSFETWYTLHASNNISSVIYWNPEERTKFEVTFNGGKLFSEGRILKTSRMYFSAGKPGLAIFVISPDHKMYIGPYKQGLHHHSSFLSGHPVLAAGEIATNDKGHITLISSCSGHYKPTAQQMHNTLNFLASKGVNLSEVALVENTSTGMIRHDSVESFRSASPQF